MKIEVLISTNELLSSQDFAINLVKQGVLGKKSFALSARHQLKGRGQGVNVWQSQKDKGIILSVVLNNLTISSLYVFDIHILCTLAIIDACKDVIGQEEIMIKWPNDLYLQNKKLSGILVQNTLNSKQIHSSIVGIGLNVHHKSFNTLSNAISLEMAGCHHLSIPKLRDSILSQIEKFFNYSSQVIPDLHQRYENLLWQFNKTISVLVNGEKFAATLKGVTRAGKIKVVINGKYSEYNYGELIWLIE